MAQAGYQHANHLASEIRTELRGNQTQMLALMKTFTESHTTDEDVSSDEDNVNHTANAVSQMTVQTETLKLLTELQKQLQRLTNEMKNTTKKSKSQHKKTPDNPLFKRANTEKYCWTHGACNHHSGECTRRAPGHQSDATKDNKKGGSEAFCN